MTTITALTNAGDTATLLTKGAATACMKMTNEWQYAGTTTFNPNGAYFLSRFFSDFLQINDKNPICETQKIIVHKSRTRYQYRLTPFGMEVRNILLSKQ